MIDSYNFDNLKKVHLIGIGGSSMNGIAEILLNYDIKVSGSDRGESDNTRRLSKLGAEVFIGHAKENLAPDCDLVIYTVAVPKDNPELVAAKALGIPVIERGKFLGYVVSRHPSSLAVAGTHGKTTTTSMIAAILIEAKKDPCVHMGGFFPLIGGSVRASKSDYLVTEACEYHRNMLNLNPFAGIILNVEEEHTDYYKGGLPEIIEAFSQFAGNINPSGFLVVCKDNACAIEASKGASCKVIEYSYNDPSAEYYASDVVYSKEGTSTYTLCRCGSKLGEIVLSVPGSHNVSNSVAAAAAAIEFGCSFTDIADGLKNFVCANRRFQCIGKYNGARLIDDYAHHPTEIKAAIKSAVSVLGDKHKLYAVFQAHTYTRAINFGDAFAEALKDADEIIVADIYAAREKDPGTVNAEMLAAKFRSFGLNASYKGGFEEIEDYLKSVVNPDDLVITLGAGNVNEVIRRIAE